MGTAVKVTTDTTRVAGDKNYNVEPVVNLAINISFVICIMLREEARKSGPWL